MAHDKRRAARQGVRDSCGVWLGCSAGVPVCGSTRKEGGSGHEGEVRVGSASSEGGLADAWVASSSSDGGRGGARVTSSSSNEGIDEAQPLGDVSGRGGDAGTER